MLLLSISWFGAQSPQYAKVLFLCIALNCCYCELMPKRTQTSAACMVWDLTCGTSWFYKSKTENVTGGRKSDILPKLMLPSFFNSALYTAVVFKVIFFVQCTKTQLITLQNSNIQTCFSHLFGFFNLKCWFKGQIRYIVAAYVFW